MALYGNLRNYEFMKETDDIRGAALYGAADEKLGKIEDIIFDQSNGDVRYVVVDAGGWLHTRMFLVPAGEITTREEGDKDFHVNMTKEQIEKLPEYKEEELESDGLWSDYEKKYDGALADGPVLHIEGSTHMITPPPTSEPQPLRSEPITEGAEQVLQSAPRPIAHEMPRFGATSNSEDSTSTGILAGDSERISRQPEAEYNGIHASLPRQENEEPVQMSRSEFLKEGTLRSEYDAPPDAGDNLELNQPASMDSGKVSAVGMSRLNPENGQRFRAFQERLRQEREEILRRRNQKDEVDKGEEAA